MREKACNERYRSACEELSTSNRYRREPISAKKALDDVNITLACPGQWLGPLERIGLPRSTPYRKIASGRFPKQSASADASIFIDNAH
jgi:hypothetical protein